MARTPVKKLRNDYVDAIPAAYSFSNHWRGEEWEYWEATQCENCGKMANGSECWKCGEETYLEGPMMDYIYPIGELDPDEDAALISHLPLCIVMIDDEFYLALTGGGMDLTWEIVEAYMCLGYLPPTHFSRLPHMAGMKLDARTKWILAGVRRSLLISSSRASRALKDLRRTRQWLSK